MSNQRQAGNSNLVAEISAVEHDLKQYKKGYERPYTNMLGNNDMSKTEVATDQSRGRSGHAWSTQANASQKRKAQL